MTQAAPQRPCDCAERMSTSEQTVLAFDFGYKRIGVAVGQLMIASSQALTTLRGDCPGPDWSAIEALLSEWQPSQLVVGHPHHGDGSDAPITAAAEAFAQQLGERAGFAPALIDEHLTSSEARAMLRDQRRTGQRKQRVKREQIDALAAQLILRDWLSARGAVQS